jgi:hypothetical protein
MATTLLSNKFQSLINKNGSGRIEINQFVFGPKMGWSCNKRDAGGIHLMNIKFNHRFQHCLGL